MTPASTTPAIGGLDSYEPTAEGLVHVRPIGADDEAALVRFHEGLSHDSQYFRFFTAHPHLTPREITRFTHVDGVDRVALVAEAGGEIVAVGRYDRLDSGDTAEVAFVVSDSHQGHGFATMLLHRLASSAVQHGIVRFVAETLADNLKMQRVFRSAGYPVTGRFEDGLVHIEFPIAEAAG